MDDNRIIDLYWERSELAIYETANKYEWYCYSISYNILHCEEDAEECVNDIYLSTWKCMPPHRPARLATFLRKITRNLSLNKFKQYKKEKRRPGQTVFALSELEECITVPDSIEQAIDEVILVKNINRFLYKQPKIERNIFIRWYWYMSAICDIVQQIHMSESKVSSVLFRLRNELKLHLEKEGILL